MRDVLANSVGVLGAGTLASDPGAAGTTLTLTTGHGARFPTIAAPDQMRLAIESEIVIVTAHAASADTMTITRAAESTTAAAHAAGVAVNSVLTAASLLACLATTAKTLVDFVSPGASDHTAAFAAAATWSSTNKLPVYIPPSATPYVTTSPVVLGPFTQFYGPYQPTYGPMSVTANAPVRVQPGAGFPANRGVFEISTTGRATGLRGFVIDGNQIGTNVSGIVFPGWNAIPELGTLIQDMEVCNCTGDGITGGARVIYLDRLMIHENNGYGININSSWFDSRVMRVYCFYNRAGGLNIDSQAALTTFFQCRFERSGQVYADPQNSANAANPPWNPAAPGIRMRGGAGLEFVECDTDANNGPGLFIFTDSATPPYRPVNPSFIGCFFNRDGQGNPTVGSTNTTTLNAGVKIQGFANAGGQNVPQPHFMDCGIGWGVSNDSGGAGPNNPVNGLWVENTEFFAWRGGDIDGFTTDCYFGAAAPTNLYNTNWRPHFDMVNRGVSFVAPPEAPPFFAAGMVRYNGNDLQVYSGVQGAGGTFTAVNTNKFVTITYAATITTDFSTGSQFAITLTGNLTLAAPSNPVDGQEGTWEFTASGAARTVTLVTTAGGFKFATSGGGATLNAVASGTTTRMKAVYRGGSVNLWRVTEINAGY